MLLSVSAASHTLQACMCHVRPHAPMHMVVKAFQGEKCDEESKVIRASQSWH